MGRRILDAIEGTPLESQARIRGINALARMEMADVESAPGSRLVITTTRGTLYAMHDAGWSVAQPVHPRRAVYETHGLTVPEAALADLAAQLETEARARGQGDIELVVFPGPDIADGSAGRRVIAWHGDPADPTTPWFTASVEQAMAHRDPGSVPGSGPGQPAPGPILSMSTPEGPARTPARL